MKSSDAKSFSLIWLLGFFASFARATFYPLIPFLAFELGLSFSQMGWITSITYTVYAVSQLPAGYLTDKIGFKKVMIGGAVIATLGLILGFTAKNFLIVLIAQALIGIGSSASLTPATSAIAKMFTTGRRGFAEGLLLSYVNASIALSLLVGGWIAEVFSWRFVYALSAVLMAMVTALFLVLSRGIPALEAPSISIKRILRVFNLNSLLLMLCIAMEVIGFQALLTYVPRYLVDVGSLTSGLAVTLAAFAHLAAIFSRPLAGKASDIVGRKLVIIATLFSGGVFSYLLMFNPSNPIVEASLFACWGLTYTGMYPVAITLIADVTEKDLRGTGIGLVTSVALFLGGLLQERLGYAIDTLGYHAFFVLLALIPALGSLLCLPVKVTKKP
ncbi:MAG: MFS transporter [Candidatus Nezhaarchaeales archaeon]